jgi:hypothetical protein
MGQDLGGRILEFTFTDSGIQATFVSIANANPDVTELEEIGNPGIVRLRARFTKTVTELNACYCALDNISGTGDTLYTADGSINELRLVSIDIDDMGLLAFVDTTATKGFVLTGSSASMGHGDTGVLTANVSASDTRCQMFSADVAGGTANGRANVAPFNIEISLRDTDYNNRIIQDVNQFRIQRLNLTNGDFIGFDLSDTELNMRCDGVVEFQINEDPGAVDEVFTSNGPGAAPTYTPGLPNSVAVAGDMVYYDGSTWVRIPTGTNGQTLTLVGGVPTWQ